MTRRNRLDEDIERMRQVLSGETQAGPMMSPDAGRRKRSVSLPGARPHLQHVPAPIQQGPWLLERTKDGNSIVKVDLTGHLGQAAAMASKSRTTGVISGTQSGKRLSIDTPIPTPVGWRTLGVLELGDLVFDADGRPTTVTFVSPISFSERAYRVSFDDGTSVLADAEHLWVTQTRAERKNTARRPERLDGVRTTDEVARSLIVAGVANHSIDISPGPQLPDRALPIPPYTLGIWLADGSSATAMITTPDAEVLTQIASEDVSIGEAKDVNAGKARGYRLGGTGVRVRNALGQWSGGDTLNAKLRELELLGDKHIPEAYLFASPAQRLALLQGLMDGDGNIVPRGQGASCELSCTNARLASDAATLIRGLGIKLRVRTRIPQLRGRPMRLNYRLSFSTDKPVFRLHRKLERLRPIRADMRRRFVVACDPIPSVPMRCIGVESPSGQYLCTTGYISTHNTILGPVWLEREIRLNGPGDYIAVTATYPLLQRKMLPEFRRYFETTLNLGRWAAADKIFVYHDGSTRVLFGSAKNPESLESASGKGAWLDEAGQLQFTLEAVEAIDRRLSLYQGRKFITTTPYAPNWLKVLVHDPAMSGEVHHRKLTHGVLTVAGTREVCMVQFPSSLNPAFPHEEMERQQGRLPTWKYRMFYEGRFDKPPGLIYSDYEDTYREEGGHLVKPFPIPPWWPRYLGLDFGGVNLARIWLAYDVASDIFYLYREELSGGKTAAQHTRDIISQLAGAPLVRSWGGAPNEESWRLEFQQAGLMVEEPPITDVEVGIDRVIGLLKQRRLLVLDNCTGIRSEFGGYTRETDDSGEPTEKIANKSSFHRLDGLRYLACGVGGGVSAMPVLAMARARGWNPRL